MKYKAFIPSAGLGSRLGDLCNNTNKALVAIANKPAISYIIDKFADDVPIVVAVGHKGDLLREYLKLAYPQRDIEFVSIDPYCGPGSGLGLTMMQCKSHLQCPFFFVSNDTLVVEDIVPRKYNWMGYCHKERADEYRCLRLDDSDQVIEICEKGEQGTKLAYIGLAYIQDYEKFWSVMQEGVGDGAITMGESYGLRKLNVTGHKFSWFDTGNREELGKARQFFDKVDGPNILNKPDEAIWFVNDKVIKYSEDQQFIDRRVHRSRSIEKYVPKVIDSTPHMYSYQYIQGNVISKDITLPLFQKLLNQLKSFWQAQEIDDQKASDFHDVCLKFYRDKTYNRINQYFHRFNVGDKEEIVNAIQTSKVCDLLDRLDWTSLANGIPVRFHGDLHFDNILLSESGGLVFLDWRQDFGGLTEYGDQYYDFAKLLHGMIVSHSAIAKNLYSSYRDGNLASFSFMRPQVLVECEKEFESFINDEGYDWHKVQVLTAIVYLNIAALHHYPYSEMLFYLGKSMLQQLV